MGVTLTQIDKVAFTNARVPESMAKTSDGQPALKPYGFIIVTGGRYMLYMEHQGKYYAGLLTLGDTPEMFMEMGFSRLYTETNVIFIDASTAPKSDKVATSVDVAALKRGEGAKRKAS
jgi:hypothetical protein